MAIQNDKNIPKSRVTLRYRTEINGVPEDVTLPLRILVAGDFSGFDDNQGNGMTYGERDVDDSSKRASIEKRQIFDAREILNVIIKDENGNKLVEKSRYNSVFDRLNIAKEKISDRAFYTTKSYLKEGAIKKLDDFNPSYFDLGKEQQDNLNISTLLAKLSNDRKFYAATRDTLKWTLDETKSFADNKDEIVAQYFIGLGLTETELFKDIGAESGKDIFDFYCSNDSVTYINTLKEVVASVDNITSFDEAKEGQITEFYDALISLQTLNTAGESSVAVKCSAQDAVKTFIGINNLHQTALDEVDDLVVTTQTLGTPNDFLGNIANYKEAFELLKNNIDLRSFLKLAKNPPYLPKSISDFKLLELNGILSFNYSVEAEGSQIMSELKSQLSDKKRDNDQIISTAIDQKLHDPRFKSLESSWRALEYLVKHTDFSKDIRIDFIDVAKSELAEDFTANRNDVANSYLFKRIYTDEYDQYGGQPYSTIIGLYEFDNSDPDRTWLQTMGKIANLAHSPFISSVGPKFFVGENDITKLAAIRDLTGHMMQNEYEQWNEFRDSEQAAYLGFTVPRFMIRRPYDVKIHKAGQLNYTETIISPSNDKLVTHQNYCWANSAILFAHNLIKSYEASSWCQTIRGPKNGGYIEHLPRHQFERNGLKLEKIPVEMVIPDYRELDFAKCGFMALVHKKGTSNVCFFSCQSIKKAKHFKNPLDTENSQLVTNLSYTLSITKIAHYIKCIMRDNIGGTADAAFINNVITSWLNGYVTTVVNPDDFTLRLYPFKAIQVETSEREGEIGWYDCVVSVSPHLQFEGLDTELRLETRL